MARKKDSPQKAALENAVSGHDRYHQEMDRTPSGLGTDPFSAGNFLRRKIGKVISRMHARQGWHSQSCLTCLKTAL